MARLSEETQKNVFKQAKNMQIAQRYECTANRPTDFKFLMGLWT